MLFSRLSHNPVSLYILYIFKNIYFRTIKQYTDVDPTVDFVFPVNKIDRENSD